MDSTMVLRSIALLAAPLMFLGCASPEEKNDNVSVDTDVPSSSSSETPGDVGIPRLDYENLCDGSAVGLSFDEWAQSADAVAFFDIDAIEINTNSVYYRGFDEGTKIPFAKCQPESVQPGLILSVSNVEVLAGSATEISEVHIGSLQTATWMPSPFVDGNVLKWSGDGEKLGLGLRMGAGLYQDPDSLKWSARGVLFELEPSSMKVNFQEVGTCFELSSGFETKGLEEFRTGFKGVSADQASVDAFRATQDFPSADKRDEFFIATHCTPNDLGPDPEEQDPEANGR